MMADKIFTALIVAGFALFVATPATHRHRLQPAALATAAGDSARAGLLYPHLKPYTGRSLNSWQVRQAINRATRQANEQLARQYALAENQRQSLLTLLLTGRLNQPQADSLLAGHPYPGYPQLFGSYAGWLYGKVFDSPARAQEALQQAEESLLQYEIIPRTGFDRYRTKQLRYDLARASLTGPAVTRPGWLLLAVIGLIAAGALGLSWQMWQEPPGIKNNDIFRHPATSRRWLGILIGTFLILFYVVLYFYPELMTAWVALADPASRVLSGNPAGPFFLYGLLYTVSVLVMGVRMLIKYRYNRYQVIRTLSVMFFQTTFAFLIPEILVRLNQPYFDFKNIWPLDYDFFFDFELNKLLASGSLGVFMLGWGIALAFVGVPVFTYFFGKRWYCSWVCGCGGLAETLGDPFRHLSDKSLRAWRIERAIIYPVLAFAVVMTAGVLYTWFTGNSTWLGMNTYKLREIYGALIGAVFAGVVGTGFYPFMGNRVWCRFGCPLAAYLGIVQRLRSRFRITTNGGQCISCGNCSTYCEMGIDVRAYAQRGENIVRASCVGCGICAAVCPRGVLKLENGPVKNRFKPNGFIKQA